MTHPVFKIQHVFPVLIAERNTIIIAIGPDQIQTEMTCIISHFRAYPSSQTHTMFDVLIHVPCKIAVRTLFDYSCWS